MSIFPSFLDRELLKEAKTTALVVAAPREYGVNFETGQMTGTIVEGLEAIKVWIWNCLHKERYRYALYSWAYGAEFEQYIGETLSDEYLQTDCEAETTEALLVNPYITALEDFAVSMSGSKLTISFKVRTTFGEMEVNTDV